VAISNGPEVFGTPVLVLGLHVPWLAKQAVHAYGSSLAARRPLPSNVQGSRCAGALLSDAVLSFQGVYKDYKDKAFSQN